MTPVVVVFSRSPLLPKQRDEIDKIWPGARIILRPGFKDASDLLTQFDTLFGDEMLLIERVSPQILNVLQARGIRPVRAVMVTVEKDADGNWPRFDAHDQVSVPSRHHGRRFRFSHLERILEMRVVTERLYPKESLPFDSATPYIKEATA